MTAPLKSLNATAGQLHRRTPPVLSLLHTPCGVGQIGELAVEDMRLLIGQDTGLPYLLPLALKILRDNPMAEGDMYEGDLLSAVLTRNPAVWTESPELGRELRAIVSALTDPPPDLQQKVERFMTP